MTSLFAALSEARAFSQPVNRLDILPHLLHPEDIHHLQAEILDLVATCRPDSPKADYLTKLFDLLDAPVDRSIRRPSEKANIDYVCRYVREYAEGCEHLEQFLDMKITNFGYGFREDPKSNEPVYPDRLLLSHLMTNGGFSFRYRSRYGSSGIYAPIGLQEGDPQRKSFTDMVRRDIIRTFATEVATEAMLRDHLRCRREEKARITGDDSYASFPHGKQTEGQSVWVVNTDRIFESAHEAREHRQQQRLLPV